jgi:hypothetical protein
MRRRGGEVPQAARRAARPTGPEMALVMPAGVLKRATAALRALQALPTRQTGLQAIGNLAADHFQAAHLVSALVV